MRIGASSTLLLINSHPIDVRLKHPKIQPAFFINTPVVRLVAILLSMVKLTTQDIAVNRFSIIRKGILKPPDVTPVIVPTKLVIIPIMQGKTKKLNAHSAWRLTMRWFVEFMMLKNRSVIKCYERALGVAISNVVYPRLTSSVVESAVCLLHWTQKTMFLDSNNLIPDSFCNAGCYPLLNPHRSLSDTRNRPDNRL